MFGDKLKQQDGVAISLECGHPNVEHGRRCTLCGCYVMKAVEKVDGDLEALLAASIEQTKKEE